MLYTRIGPDWELRAQLDTKSKAQVSGDDRIAPIPAAGWSGTAQGVVSWGPVVETRYRPGWDGIAQARTGID